MIKNEMFEDFDEYVQYLIDEMEMSFEMAYEMATSEIYN